MEHIHKVRQYIEHVSRRLQERGAFHDASKLEEPEKEAFDRCTPLLKETVYGSEEYKAACRELGPALKHHHEHNRHHPEFHADGVAGMTLIDLIEMLCDWKAASERHADGGDVMKSVEINQQRHGYTDEVASILRHTISEMGW